MTEQIFEKKCTQCREPKPLSAFCRMSAARDGRRPECHDCTRKNARPPKFGRCITCGCVLRKSSETGKCAKCLNTRRVAERRTCACGRQLKGKDPECSKCRRARRYAGDPTAFIQVSEKVCFRCKGNPQPIENFGESKDNKDGHKGVCKTCRAKEDDEWYAAHKDESSARTKAYYKANKPRLDAENKKRNAENIDKYRPAKRAGQRRRYKEDPSKVLASASRRHATLRVEMLMAFSGFCVCCGETDLRLLTFDHKNGDGADHRRQMAGSQKANAHVVLRWIEKNMEEAKQTMQVLCWTCNAGSWKNGGICPHQQEFNIVAMATAQAEQLAA